MVDKEDPEGPASIEERDRDLRDRPRSDTGDLLIESTSVSRPALDQVQQHTRKLTAPPLGLPDPAADDRDSSPPAPRHIPLPAGIMGDSASKKEPSVPIPLPPSPMAPDLEEEEVEAPEEDESGIDGWTRHREERFASETGTRPSPRVRTRSTQRKLGPPETLEKDDALKLVDRSRKESKPLDLATDMSERFALGDYSGSLIAAELILGTNPSDASARRYADACRERLEQLYSSRLGGLGRIPQVAIPVIEIPWLGLDTDAESILGLVDGRAPFSELIERSGLDHVQASKALVHLLDLNVIRVS